VDLLINIQVSKLFLHSHRSQTIIN